MLFFRSGFCANTPVSSTAIPMLWPVRNENCGLFRIAVRSVMSNAELSSVRISSASQAALMSFGWRSFTTVERREAVRRRNMLVPFVGRFNGAGCGGHFPGPQWTIEEKVSVVGADIKALARSSPGTDPWPPAMLVHLRDKG